MKRLFFVTIICGSIFINVINSMGPDTLQINAPTEKNDAKTLQEAHSIYLKSQQEKQFLQNALQGLYNKLSAAEKDIKAKRYMREKAYALEESSPYESKEYAHQQFLQYLEEEKRAKQTFENIKKELVVAQRKYEASLEKEQQALRALEEQDQHYALHTNNPPTINPVIVTTTIPTNTSSQSSGTLNQVDNEIWKLLVNSNDENKKIMQEFTNDIDSTTIVINKYSKDINSTQTMLDDFTLNIKNTDFN